MRVAEIVVIANESEIRTEVITEFDRCIEAREDPLAVLFFNEFWARI